MPVRLGMSEPLEDTGPKPPRLPNMPGEPQPDTPNHPVEPPGPDNLPVEEPPDERRRKDDDQDDQLREGHFRPANSKRPVGTPLS